MSLLTFSRSNRIRSFANRAPRWPFVLNEDSPQAQNLTARWPIAVGGVFGLDVSLYNFPNLTKTNGIVIQPNPFGGYGASFTDTSSELDSGSVDAPLRIGAGTNDFSVFVWGTTTESGRRVIFSTRFGATDGFRLYKFDGSTLELQLDDGDTATSFNSATDLIVDDGLPHLWGVTVSRSSVATFYEDGIAHGTADITARNGDLIGDAGENIIRLGKNPGNTTQTWDNGGGGMLWDVRVYNWVVPNVVAHAMFDPTTRWDLDYELGRIKYYFLPSVADSFDVAQMLSPTPRWDNRMRFY